MNSRQSQGQALCLGPDSRALLVNEKKNILHFHVYFKFSFRVKRGIGGTTGCLPLKKVLASPTLKQKFGNKLAGELKKVVDNAGLYKDRLKNMKALNKRARDLKRPDLGKDSSYFHRSPFPFLDSSEF